MSFQPKEEKIAERKLIISFAARINAKIIKLQEDNDNGGTDGFVEYNGKIISVEARRKGYPNHKGKSFFFNKGWETKCLINDGGIFINESTIENHKNKGFVFVVDIKGFPPRACVVDVSKINKLLSQPHRKMKSTNSGSMQSVKTVPLSWFTLVF